MHTNFYNNMPLGDVDQQTQRMEQFKQVAGGLGYAPEQIEAFSKFATMGQGLRTSRDEEKRRAELDDYRAKIQIQNDMAVNTPFNPETDPTIQRMEWERANPSTSPGTLDDMLATRKLLLDNNLNTSALDEKISAFGVDPSKRNVSESDQIGVGLVDEILSSKTAPLTGAMRLGNTDGMFGVDPIGAINRLLRPDLETTKAKVDQLKGILQLAQASKLKGQGQISDKEREMLTKAATALNYKMSDKAFRKELINIRGILSGEKAGGKAEDLINSYWK